MKNKNIILIIAILLIGLLTVGGTYAVYNFLWSSQLELTNGGTFADSSECFDITYNAGTDIKGRLFPSSTPAGGLTGVVTVGINSNCSVVGKLDINLNINSGSDPNGILTQTVDAHCENPDTLETLPDHTESNTCTTNGGNWVASGTALKYAVYRDGDASDGSIISVCYINSPSGTLSLYSDIIEPGAHNYNIYIWLDGNISDNTYENQDFSANISSSIEQQEEVIPSPQLDASMIPVKISYDGTAKTVSSNDLTWHNYGSKVWANAVLVKETGTQTRSYYKNNIGVTVAEEDILAYYVWIPRYKYKIWTDTTSSAGNEQTIDILFENANEPVTQGNKVGEYITHPAFIWDGQTISGFWVGKFETSHTTFANTTTANSLACTTENCANADGIVIKPNVRSLRYNSISNFFYGSRSMSRNGNPFGFNSSTTDTHMMKNSEWGAVAYLSHSKYGLNREIYINNSAAYVTGRSGGNVANNVKTLATQFPDTQTSTNKYNNYGYYTWTGKEISDTGTIGEHSSDRTTGTNASTTGNVTGIYDMSGGAYEYVMGYYSGANSNYASNSTYFGWTESENKAGFTSVIPSKYWNNYKTLSELTACDGKVCFGHALSEVSGWGSANHYFTIAYNPWNSRSGKYDSSGFGEWILGRAGGNSVGEYTFRSVLVVQ